MSTLSLLAIQGHIFEAYKKVEVSLNFIYESESDMLVVVL